MAPISPRFRRKLLKQASENNLSLLDSLKEADPNFHWSSLILDTTGDTLLHQAVRWGHSPLIKALIAFGRRPSLECGNNDGKTALHEAAQHTQFEAAKILLEHGASVNALKRSDWTPLMLACTKDSSAMVELLLKKGALVNCRNKDGWTALHLNCRQGNIEICNLLIQYGADYLDCKTKNGRSPLHIATLHGNTDIVKVLLIKDLRVDVNCRDSCGNTPVHEAVLSGNLDLVRFLISSGADVTLTNNVNYNALHLASSQGHGEVIKYLLDENKMDPNWKNNEGLAAIHCAARNRHKDTCQLLIQYGGDMSLTDGHGRTADDYLNS